MSATAGIGGGDICACGHARGDHFFGHGYTSDVCKVWRCLCARFAPAPPLAAVARREVDHARAWMLELASSVVRGDAPPDAAHRLAQGVLALDEWLVTGGARPGAWERAPLASKGGG